MDECSRCKLKTPRGHETNCCAVHGERGRVGDLFIPRHYCCPDNCELDHPEELEASVEFWKKLSKERNHDFMFMAEDALRLLTFLKKLDSALDKTKQG